MSQKKAELLLAVIVIANSSSYLLTKVGMGDMGPFNLISVRFALAFLACLPFCFGRLAKASRATLRCAAQLCLFMFSVMALQIYGLRTITSAEAGFFSSTTVIMPVRPNPWELIKGFIPRLTMTKRVPIR